VQRCRQDGTGLDDCQCGPGGTGGTSTAQGGKGGSSGKGGNSGKGGGPNAGTGGVAGGPVEPGEDADGDGFTALEGDCADDNALVGPRSFEVAGNGLDDDCDGTVDNAVETCDGGLGPVIGNPLDAMKALGICGPVVPKDADIPVGLRKPGLIEAAFANPAGPFLVSPPKSGANTSLQLGILPNFGAATQPQEGTSLLALSSGVARATGQPDATKDLCSNSKSFSGIGTYPVGFPKEGDCGKGGKPNDAIAIDFRVRAPINAKSFRVRFKFFTCEYPDYTCSSFNDVFALLMSPSPLQAGDPMADANNASANVAFEGGGEGKKNVIGVNNTSFLVACKKDSQAPEYKNCVDEQGILGSGFEGHAGSAWLESRVPVPVFAPDADRVISLRLAIWDSSDAILDSTAVVDGFAWSDEEVPTALTVIAP
jgi:hypothetical protein